MSGTKRIIRLKPLRAAMRCVTSPLTIGLAGLMLSHGAVCADQVSWDCRMAPDGRNWQCYKDGQLVQDPVEPDTDAAAVVSPLKPPPETQALEPAGRAAPAPADVSPKPPPADATVEKAATPPTPVSVQRPPETVTGPTISRESAAAAEKADPEKALSTLEKQLSDKAAELEKAPEAADVKPSRPAATPPPASQDAMRAFDEGAMPDLLETEQKTPEPEPEPEDSTCTRGGSDR